jgi:DNA-binding MarR family transcriptional regulator
LLAGGTTGTSAAVAGTATVAACGKYRAGDYGRPATYRLTKAGWEATRSAAPKHVETVRQLFLDPLDPEQISQMTKALQRIITQLEPGQ